jgi:hypothetical protein
MNKLKYITSLVLTVAMLFSCEQSLEELNVDPNNPAEATPELTLPAAMMSSAAIFGGRYAIIGGIWSQYYTQNNSSNQYKDIDAFYLTPSDFNTSWQEVYAGALRDYKYVREGSASDGNWALYLMATVMEAYTFQVMVDAHGDVPFTNALKGDQGILTPEYDEPLAIYDSLIIRIDNALSKDFTAKTVLDPGSFDLIFGPQSGAAETPLEDDINKWIKFANTLKLKMYLRQTNVRPAVAQAGIEALWAANAEFLTEAAALDRFQDVASKSNPMYEQDQRQLNTTTNLKASKSLFDFLLTNADPRIEALYIAGSSGQKAMEQGDFNAKSTTLDPLSVSRARLRATDPVYFISKAESYYLQAEAEARYGSDADAEALYNLGLAAAFEQAGFTDGMDLPDKDGVTIPDFFFDTYIGDGGEYEYGNLAIEVAPGEEGLASIILHKWISMSTTRQGLEAFFERKRTGYPNERDSYAPADDYVVGDLAYPKEGTTSLDFSARFFYPQAEVSRNPNTPEQVLITTRNWFHQ